MRAASDLSDMDEPTQANRQHELEAQLDLTSAAIRAAVLGLLRDGEAHPHVLVLAVARAMGEVGAASALAGRMPLEAVLGDLAYNRAPCRAGPCRGATSGRVAGGGQRLSMARDDSAARLDQARTEWRARAPLEAVLVRQVNPTHGRQWAVSGHHGRPSTKAPVQAVTRGVPRRRRSSRARETCLRDLEPRP